MIEQAIALLQNAGFDLTAREIAEILWLSTYITSSSTETPSQEPTSPPIALPSPPPSPPSISSSQLPSASVTLPSYRPSPSPTKTPQPSGGVPLKVPVPPALRNSLDLAKALRPLKRKVPSSTEVVIDEVATATRIAEVDLRIPVLQPTPQRWLELALVIEQNSTTAVWKQTLVEFQHLLQHQGAFRDVRTWGLKEIEGKIQLFAQTQTGDLQTTAHSPKELIDARGQKLILLVSDCISPLWRKGTIHQLLELWGKQGLLTLLQLLPARLWERTALAQQVSSQLSSLSFDPQLRNYQLAREFNLDEDDEEIPSDLAKTMPVLPVVTLEPASLSSWAKVLVGAGKNQTVGYCFRSVDHIDNQSQPSTQTHLSASDLVNRFRATASPLARYLAGLMAVVPTNISVVHLIQKTLLPQSSQLHVAEVFMSGLLKSFPSAENPNMIEYDFVEGVREMLRQSVSPSEGILVIEKVSEYIAKRYGLSSKSLAAILLEGNDILDPQTANSLLPLARLSAQALRQWGGEFERIAQKLDIQATKQEWLQELNLQLFPFETIFVNKRGETIETRLCQAYYYDQPLNPPLIKGGKGGSNLIKGGKGGSNPTVEPLRMIYIPAGEFLMGSPEGEDNDNEKPQHKVTVPAFLMSQTPITQVQWQFVANLPQIQRKLEANPSNFKGDNNPVERVSWYDAVEFCARLSDYSGKDYRLPSEAEWEYACRSVPNVGAQGLRPTPNNDETTSDTPLPLGEGQGERVYPPFYFGETLTGELANYGATTTYTDELKGEYRQQTTPVRQFPPNAFGLYDMHGNVWEWCLDPWHNNYEGAPSDGRVWDERNNSNNHYQNTSKNIDVLLRDNRTYVLRGGSWRSNARLCRSAYRFNINPDDDYYLVGFRVVCVLPRT